MIFIPSSDTLTVILCLWSPIVRTAAFSFAIATCQANINIQQPEKEEKKKIPHRPRSVVWELIPFTALWADKGEAGVMVLPARRQSPNAVLNPIKLAYSPGRPDGRLSLTASAFNRLRAGFWIF